jgi:hypothetical protein
VISDSFCDLASKPSLNVSCPATQDCAYYSWLVGNETCPTACGLISSNISRSLLCIATSASNPMGSQVAESFCDEDHKPATTLDCPATAPCAPYWFAPELQCPSACGLPNSTLERLVQCKAIINGQVVVVEDSYCTDTKPSSTVSCPATAACGSYVWVVGPEKCPTTCGLADTVITITVTCAITAVDNPMGLPVADSFCDASLKPVNQLHCAATAPCAPYWFGEFVHCPTDCGLPASHVNRLVQCLGTVAGSVVVVSDSYCTDSKPSNLVLCPATQDCVCYKWSNAPQPCPTECGLLASIVSQNVVCLAFSEHNAAGTPVADSFCDLATKPVASLQCPATAPCSPFWFTSEVQCPTYCGLPQTNLTRLVQCKGTVNGTIIVVDNQFCAGSAPPPFVICPATAECVIYQWQIGNETCPQECGLLASNLTRSLQCLATTLSNPSGTVVDNSFCDLSVKPDSLLNCPATVPCAPYWFVQDVQCPTACGLADSMVPRVVQCKGTINGEIVVIADSFCSGAKPVAFLSCYATPECITYNWVVGNESCPTACGLLASNLTQSLFCYAFTLSNPLGSRVADSFCSGIAIPNIYLSCLATPPCSPFWYAPAVQCPYGCGFAETPVQRDVVCKGLINGQVVVVADSWCSGSKPPTVIVCPATAECVHYNWTIGNETCPTACGLLSSSILRTVHCLAITNSNPQGSIVDDSFCDMGSKPDASLSCAATAPCSPFWFSSSVSCPTYCGLPASNVTRTVQCKGTVNGQVVDVAASFCLDMQPPTFVTCPATPECVFYNWRLGNEMCPTECGLLASTLTRSLACIATSASNPAGTVVADSFCVNIVQPNNILACPATAPCAPYWFAAEVQCPTYCGLAASVIHRVVQCKGTINGLVVTVADSYCNDTKPADTITCSATPECITYVWQLGNEQCPTACGLASSTLNRSVVCLATSSSNPEGVVVADSFCANLARPFSLVQCGATPPCSPFWWTSEVQCPTYCGLAQSSVTRLVQCKGTVMGVEIIIADSYCTASKPSTTVVCPATAECVYYNWTIGNAQCPTACGLLASNISRAVQCVATTLSNPTGTPVADSFCDLSTKPTTIVPCLATPPCSPFWFTSGVYCDTGCGLPATPMPRTVQCEGTINGQVVVIADSWCSMNKPPATFICSPTPECIYYNWSLGPETCPDLCGLLPSNITRSLVCLATTASNPLGNVVDDSFCDLVVQPNPVLLCDETAPCAPFWFTCDVTCPTDCGLAESNVTREVTCKGLINGEVVAIADSWCQADQPQPVVLCPATDECVFYNWRLGEEACPIECGMLASTLTRSLYCIATSASNPNGTILPDSYCSPDNMPDTTLNCSATPPCGPFWFTSDVTCPSYCGTPASNVSRTVQCKGIVEDTVVVIADSWCASAGQQPNNVVVCPATEECVTYQWSLQQDHCPTDCGLLASNITQQVVCLAVTASNPAGTIVADSFCAQLALPNVLLLCPATAPCAPYWSTDVECPIECGLLESNVSNGVVCKGTINGELVVIADSWCSGPKPVVPCSATPPCAPYWDTSNVHCPDACGLLASFTTQGVVCKGTVGGQVVVLPDSWCSGAKPPVACPATPPCAAPSLR